MAGGGKQKKGFNKRAERDVLAAPSSKKSSAKSAKPQENPTDPTKPTLSPEAIALHQKVLGIFQTAFNEVLSSSDFTQTLQEVKSALYDRDFDRAFSREEYLEVYAARWSPTRALGYAAVFEGLREWLEGIYVEEESTDAAAVSDRDAASTTEQLESMSLHEAGPALVAVEEAETANGGDSDDKKERVAETHSSEPAPRKQTLKLLALGGGTAELAAFASFLSSSPGTSGNITLLDTGPWSGAVTKLHDTLLVPPPIYKYASAAAKAANTPLVAPGQLQHTFLQQDILTLSSGKLKDILGAQPLLLTLLFTLNELYTSGGIGKTTSFLRSLSKVIPVGSLLLVVDSPGSYSEAAVGGKEKKKYPMSWLMNHTLVGSGDRKKKRAQDEDQGDETSERKDTKKEEPEEGCRWEKLEENDSVWFRLADDLKYPIQLENMRYQIHLYRATTTAQARD